MNMSLITITPKSSNAKNLAHKCAHKVYHPRASAAHP